MRIAICDDDKQEAQEIGNTIREWDDSRSIEVFTSGKELIEAAKKIPRFSIIFMDIYLPRENGVEIAEEIKKISPETEIAFVTTSTGHAIEAFAINAIHYLVKPVGIEDIREVFYRLSQKNIKNEKSLLVNVGRNMRRIHLNDISQIQSINHAVEILTSDGSCIKVWMTLEEIKSQLDDCFLKVQRGIVVNMNYIEQMGTDSCVLRDGTKLLLSRKEKTAIKEKYSNYAFENISGKI